MDVIHLRILFFYLVLCIFVAQKAGKIRPKSRMDHSRKDKENVFQSKIAKNNLTICKFNKPTTNMPVYWVNLENSVNRRRTFEQHMFEVGFQNLRLHAFTPAEYEISLPCFHKSPREIACIISHLAAMYRAVYDTSQNSTTPYALILEDDVRFQFNIDFDKLVESAPKDFGILQLVTSSDHFSRHLWEKYKKTGELWSKRNWDDGYWSTQAFLINKVQIKKLVDEVVREDEQGRIKFHLLTKMMKEKCLDGECVRPFCLAADTYLYNNGGPTYTTNIPYFNGAGVGFNSTIHTRINNAISHEKGFQVIENVVEEAKSGQYKLPPFISAPKCYNRLVLS